ncbi:AAA family ATPase [Legionella tunisiensis]|uniref:AAA family ATPase n=1 Tax=Legionella tunisiensis TaxID=1034944 RepID=UPI0002D57826|nr:AAA family ATPase [Legionella tunisiensis]
MIIVFGGEKGGTGKTTLATNIAAELALRGKEVLLIDTDRQESSSSWCFVREEEEIRPRIPCILKFGETVRQEINELKNKFNNIIVDCGGRDSIEFRAALLAADKAIIPMRSTQFDLWTLSRFSKILAEVRIINEFLQVGLLLNAANTNPAVKEHEEAKEYIKEFGNMDLYSTIVRDRIAFHKAAAEGRSVSEITPNDQKASLEINSLYEEIFG